MNGDDFSAQMQRLIKTYGPTAYSDERLKLIANEVDGFSSEWLKSVVDELIGTQRQPPLVDAFAQAATIERERLWKLEREREREAAKAFFGGEIEVPDEDRAMIFHSIRTRMTFNGTRDRCTPEEVAKADADWAAFMSSLTLAFGPIEPLTMGTFSRHPKIEPRRREIPPDVAERARKNLPYADN